MSGNKNDKGKARISLLSAPWLMGVARVATHGANRPEYGPHNWRNGIDLSRLLDGAQRHLWAFIGGEDVDDDTRECHLLNASCMIMFAYETWLRRKDLDDRFKLDIPITELARCPLAETEDPSPLQVVAQRLNIENLVEERYE